MSATGRSDVRQPDDFYSTPAWCTRAILPFLDIGDSSSVLDPCAGDGAILDVVKAERPRATTHAIELDFKRALICLDKHNGTCRDALSGMSWPTADLILTNPPYGMAMEFISKALVERVINRTVAMLLRLNFLGGQKRAAWHRAHPADVYVLPRRPSFTSGGTDSCEYAWFVWASGREGRVRVLECEGTKERRPR